MNTSITISTDAGPFGMNLIWIDDDKIKYDIENPEAKKLYISVDDPACGVSYSTLTALPDGRVEAELDPVSSVVFDIEKKKFAYGYDGEMENNFKRIFLLGVFCRLHWLERDMYEKAKIYYEAIAKRCSSK